MINHISIKNFAIIENAEIDFHTGLNVITGESGSGKSIVANAISLALGARADSSLVRNGAQKAVIQMVVEYRHNDYVITREISTSGKNLCKINGDIVSLGELQDLMHKVADIHGQYDTQSLLNPEFHINIVDSYEKKLIHPAIEKVGELYDKYKSILKNINQLKMNSENSLQQREYYEYIVKEIHAANLLPGEDDELSEKLVEEQHREKIAQHFSLAYDYCTSDDIAPINAISKIINELRNIKGLSKDASELEDDFLDIYYRLEDINNKVRNANEKSNYGIGNLDSVIERLNIINSYKQKYGDTIEAINDYAEELEKKITSMANLDSDIKSMEIELERNGEMLKTETKRLTHLRTSTAKALQEKIQQELKDLGFKNTKVVISVTQQKKYTANGIDSIEFMIITNVGEELKPLSKIASGGEISRIMLAFKNIIGEYDGVETFIFDEIDSGISGSAASTVANKLVEISQKHQIITITHLPQIAAKGNHNYTISKHIENNLTYTTIDYLSESAKVKEIARLLSGTSVTDIALENAKTLIND